MKLLLEGQLPREIGSLFVKAGLCAVADSAPLTSAELEAIFYSGAADGKDDDAAQEDAATKKFSEVVGVDQTGATLRWREVMDDVFTSYERLSVEPTVRERLRSQAFGVLTQHDRSSGAQPDTRLDQLLQALLPARTRNDLRLRNVRYYDLFRTATKLDDGIKRLRELWDCLTPRFDYICALNICFYGLLLPSSSYAQYAKFVSLSDGTWCFVGGAKKVSDVLKTQRSVLPNFHLFFEMQSLAGYRNLPVPGFDVEAKAAALAEKPDEQWFPADFKSVCQELLTAAPVKRVEWMGLRDWIASGRWATAGSSSEGKIELQLADGTAKFVKARKNVVLDAIDVDTLHDLCTSAASQANVVLVKCELGKVRIAVASDLAGYINSSWLVYLTGDASSRWADVTLEESLNDKIERMWQFKAWLEMMFGVPFDFQEFDHQPQTSQLVEIADVTFRNGDSNVPSHGRAEWESTIELVLSSFHDSWLIVKANGAQKEWPVEGGVMSGLYLTSKFGNAWNVIIVKMAKIFMEYLGASGSTIKSVSQGDDTAAFTTLVRLALIFIRCMQVMKIRFASGKFSIRWGETEYLRLFFSTGKCVGYPARTLPNFVQRKPWSNDPWSPTLILAGVWSKCAILGRRLGQRDRVAVLWQVFSEDWALFHRLPVGSISVPTALGGLGVGVWDCRTRIIPAVPVPTPPSNIAVPATRWRENKVATFAEKAGFSAVDFDIAAMAQAQMSATVAADDVPDVVREVRENWRTAIEYVKPRVVLLSERSVTIGSAIPPPHYLAPTAHTPALLADWFSRLRYLTAAYGSEAQAIARVKQVAELLRYRRTADQVTLVDWIRLREPALSSALRGYSSRAHLSEVMDFLAGTVSLPTTQVPPELTDIFCRYCILATGAAPGRSQQFLRTVLPNLSTLETQFMSNSIMGYCFANN